MDNHYFYLKNLLFLSEFIAAGVAILTYKRFKNTHWKWFNFYLVFIFLAELTSKALLSDAQHFNKYYYDFFVIPIEFIFLYWLYSYKSLGNRKLFWISCILYLLSLLPYFVFEGQNIINSFNYIVGAFLLSIMIILEYNKQMKTDDILRFKENIMFYINTGVGFFYVGTLPFFSFSSLLWKNKVIWHNYYILFMITNILMYALFSIALLWGKPNTYSSR
jgi:hypothetical protein